MLETLETSLQIWSRISMRERGKDQKITY